MKIRLLTYDGNKSSAVKLGFPVDKELPPPVEDHGSEVVVRWGNSISSHNRYGLRRDYPHVINHRAAISLNCCKHKALAALSEVVRTPEQYNYRVPSGKKAVVRPHEHIGGKEWLVVAGPYIIPDGWYGAEFIKTDMECRVWFCGQHTMVAKRAKSADRSEHPNRAEWGYEFAHRFDPLLGYDTLKAAAKLNLDCGAADVLCLPHDRIFLELNSAPSIDHWRIEEFFKTHLPQLAAEKFNER